jgi:hypothetical protein
MGGAADPAASLEKAIGPVARTFTELGEQIAGSTFTKRWKDNGIWATGVLADALGEDWLGRFQAKSLPYLKFVLAPHRLRSWRSPWNSPYGYGNSQDHRDWQTYSSACAPSWNKRRAGPVADAPAR